MITRFLLIFIFSLSAVGCKAETKDSKTQPGISITEADTETVLTIFSNAILEKNVNSFLSITDAKGIYLVRKFTSGNLGGRGPKLSELINPLTINDKLQFPIKNQTPYSVKSHFPELPIKSYKALPRRSLLLESDANHFDQWESSLKKSLKGVPEAIKADPVLLVSSSSKYLVYAEAQIIDDILVGGFAIFSMQDGKLKLVSLVQLL